MRAMLVLKYLFLPGRAETIIGYGFLKSTLESVFSPLAVQPLASQVYGLYMGFAYFTPIIGGRRIVARLHNVVRRRWAIA